MARARVRCNLLESVLYPTNPYFFTSAAGREKTPRDVVSRVMGPDASALPTSA